MMYPGITVTARTVRRALPRPEGYVTNTAPTARTALAVRVGKATPDRIWGSLPVEEIEGHTPDPAYDVRPIEGLGRAPIRSERRGLGFSREILDRVEQARVDARDARLLARPAGTVAAAAASSQPELDQAIASYQASEAMSAIPWVPLVALAGVLLFLKRR